MGEEKSQLALGKVARPHGVAGLLKVDLYWNDSESLLQAKKVYLSPPIGVGKKSFGIHKAQRISGGILLGLEGIADRDQAEALRGFVIWVSREDLPPLEDGEFFLQDLPGLKVFDEDGGEIGTIQEAFETAANIVAVVKTEAGGELLLPIVDDVVAGLDLAGGTMRIFQVSGLMDVQ